VGSTVDAYFAMNKIKTLQPDIIILDIQMPKMNGLDFLKKLMAEYPTPVLMFSSQTQEGSDMALKALELGAIDCVGKPQENLTKNLYTARDEIIQKIKSISKIKIRDIIAKRPEILVNKLLLSSYKPVDKEHIVNKGRKSKNIIVIGASTGGTRAVTEILKELPPDSPPILIVQHMPPVFTTRFAENINNLSKIKVVEAQEGERVVQGKAYIAPGGYHMLIKRDSMGYVINITEGPPVNHHKPSVDLLFRSVSRVVKHNAIGVILTGMGNDGAVGMKEMKEAGAYNIAQNEETCVVFGMPKEAIALRSVDIVLPLENIAKHIIKKIGYDAD